MIAVDTSAIIAILLKEPAGVACLDALAQEPQLVMSAVTLIELKTVARKCEVLRELEELMERIPMEIVSVDHAAVPRVTAAQVAWGKGNHRAKLNIIDCFAYDLARQFGCPLLFTGNDFSQTDITPAVIL